MNRDITQILQILREFKKKLIKILDDNVVNVSLFGSYAKEHTQKRYRCVDIIKFLRFVYNSSYNMEF